MNKKIAFILLFGLISFTINAQNISKVWSPSMSDSVRVKIVLPDNYTADMHYPVLYLLHGFGGNENHWTSIRPDMTQLATRFDFIIVCPDGKNSWYFDSPVDPSSRYETFIVSELIPYIDSSYSTIADSTGRGITGLSMGGHGALWLAIRHPEVFGACGSTSGGVDLSAFPDGWNLKDVLGVYADNTERWRMHSVINLLDSVDPGLAIIFDCGSEDFFHDVNRRLHDQMLSRKIPHDYISRPGSHNDKYWSNALMYQLQFFSDRLAGAR